MFWGIVVLSFWTEVEGTKVQHLKTSGTTRPMEQHNIPEDLHFLKYWCGNLVYHNYYPPLCHVIE
jgi:hypothetical protein